MGACDFDAETLSFAGTPVEQAMCLMRGMDATRNLGPPLAKSAAGSGEPHRPRHRPAVARGAVELCSPSKASSGDFAAHLWEPVSRADDNDPDAPLARYFVIHDTSGPNYGHRAFPDNIDTDPEYENLADYACSDGWGRAHVFVNRTGEMLVAHDYSIAWRETKFEQAAEFGGALQGLFLHNELVQPRRSAPHHSSRNDAQTPDPGLHRRAIRSAGAALHDRQRARRPMAHSRLPRRHRRRYSRRP